MDETGARYDETLAEAGRPCQAREADPTADVGGYDAAAKAAILARIAFHTRVTAADVYRRRHHGGHRRRSGRGQEVFGLDCTVKLLAICERVVGDGGERVSARVYPALVPLSHPLARSTARSMPSWWRPRTRAG